MFAAAKSHANFGNVKAAGASNCGKCRDFSVVQGFRLSSRGEFARMGSHDGHDRNFEWAITKNFGTRKGLRNVYLIGINDGKPFWFAPQYI